MKSRALIERTFKDYYTNDYRPDPNLSMIGKREFGFTSFEGWMLRHKSFKNEEELASFLRDSVPRDAYLSCAYYEDPETEMEKKGWLGADLIFDIDADHIPTSCDKVHDEWACGSCGFAGRGVVPEKCPACGGEKFDSSTWPCEVCLASAKTETLKLLDILMEYFGLSEKEIRVFFSGHRGYHVQVESESTVALDSIARKEIVDYVSGLGLEISFDGSNEKHQKSTRRYEPSQSGYLGWNKRITLGVQDVIHKASEQDLISIGVGKREARSLLSKKESVLKSLLATGTLNDVKGVGFETWRKIADHSIRMQSANIDTVVTTDIHRLIRLQGTLHGKTGFRKIEFPASSIHDFDPFRSAIAFKGGTTTVLVYNAPEFRLCDEMFGPYKDQKVELPTAAAVLLVCKDRAEVLE